MADFTATMKIIHVFEGDEYVNDPDDPGGETKCGISKRYHPDVDIKSLTWETASPIYKSEYWDKISGDYLKSQYLADSMMDVAVNIGVIYSVLCAQHGYNLLVVGDPLVEDGQLGPKTLTTLNKYQRPNEIAKMVEGFQFVHYINRIMNKPSQEKFLRSWLRRIDIRQSS